MILPGRRLRRSHVWSSPALRRLRPLCGGRNGRGVSENKQREHTDLHDTLLWITQGVSQYEWIYAT